MTNEEKALEIATKIDDAICSEREGGFIDIIAEGILPLLDEIDRLKAERQNDSQKIQSLEQEILSSLLAAQTSSGVVIGQQQQAIRKLSEGLNKTQWGDGQSDTCQVCDSLVWEKHREGCIVGDALSDPIVKQAMEEKRGGSQ